MREILFRGKRLHDNKWIYGNFVSDCEGNPHIIEPRFFCEDGHHLQYEDNTDTPVFIIPETVGQYTGLTDKNGVRIFEGDVVDYISSDVIGNPKTGTIIVKDMTDYDTMIYLNHSDELQIIGNIHDNPELLGGENNGINR